MAALQTTLWMYWIGFAVGWVALSMLTWLWIRKTLPTAVLLPAVVVLAVALGLRLPLVLHTESQLSDDIYRYMGDGAMLNSGVNPYGQAPGDFFGTEEWPGSHINHPDVVSIYQPASQWVFALLHRLHRLIENDSNHRPYPDQVFRLGFVFFDLCVIALLLLKLQSDGRSLWWAALYAWHPLTVTEVGWSGHQDVIGIAALLATLLLLEQRSASDQGGRLRAVLAGLCFALAFGVKPVVLPLALPLAWAMRSRPDLLLGTAVSTLLTLVGLYLPFALMEGGLWRMFDTGLIFAGYWRFNGSVHAVLGWALALFGAPPWLANLLLGIIVVAVLVVLIRRRIDLYQTALVYLLACLLLSSTVHPWYLLWPLALLPASFDRYPAWVVWVWSLTISFSYAVLIAYRREGAAYEISWWLKLIEYVPVYGILIWGLLRVGVRVASPKF